MKVGILVGRENTFPQAFIDTVNERDVDGVRAEMIELDGTRMDEAIPYGVIVDRISHEVPYYRAYVKKAWLDGSIVINNPFWWSADDKFFECVLSGKLGVPVPRTVVLPNRAYEADITEDSLRNLRTPIDWNQIVRYTGLPAVLKPAIGGGNKNISVVHSIEDLSRAWEQSGPLLMIVQEYIEQQNYVRCFCIGREKVLVSRYGHYRPREERYMSGYEGIGGDLMATIVRNCIVLNQSLGYDMNTVEMAIRDGVPYAIDFLNPAPDMDRLSIKDERFEWVVNAMADMVIDFATGRKQPAAGLAWQELPRASSAAEIAT